jgi:hypothetical protein
LVVTGSVVIDTSGNNAADLAAIKLAVGGTTLDSSSEALAIFKSDTNGDGSANEVAVWYLASDTAANAVIDTATHLATFSGYSTSADLAGDFAAADFDF